MRDGTDFPTDDGFDTFDGGGCGCGGRGPLPRRGGDDDGGVVAAAAGMAAGVAHLCGYGCGHVLATFAIAACTGVLAALAIDAFRRRAEK